MIGLWTETQKGLEFLKLNLKYLACGVGAVSEVVTSLTLLFWIFPATELNNWRLSAATGNKPKTKNLAREVPVPILWNVVALINMTGRWNALLSIQHEENAKTILSDYLFYCCFIMS